MIVNPKALLLRNPVPKGRKQANFAGRLLHCSISLLLIAFSAKAKTHEGMAYPSPDGRWSYIVTWVSSIPPESQGYTSELRDARTEKSYLKDTKFEPDAMLPQRMTATWSPNGSYVAVDEYWGRVAYGVSVVDLTGKHPRMLPSLFPTELTDYAAFQIWTDHWLDDNTLQIEADLLPSWNNDHPETDYNLVIRFDKNGGRIIKKELIPP
jgi:hypothetical protein